MSVLATLVAAVALFGSTIVEAANTPKIKYIRISQTSNGSYGAYRLEVATENLSPTAEISVDVDQSRTLTLKPDALSRRVAVESYAGEPGKEGIIVSLSLTNAKGTVVYQGYTTLGGGVLHGRWDGKYTDGKQPAWSLSNAQLHPTATKGRYGVSFYIIGDSTLDVTGGSMTMETVVDGEKSVVSVTPIDESLISAELVFGTPVRFDGDPVGYSYEVTVKVSEEGKRTAKETTTLEVIQFPVDANGPGPILSVSSNGKGTRNVATSNNGKPSLL
jgi:hypothetical protein